MGQGVEFDNEHYLNSNIKFFLEHLIYFYFLETGEGMEKSVAIRMVPNREASAQSTEPHQSGVTFYYPCFITYRSNYTTLNPSTNPPYFY